MYKKILFLLFLILFFPFQTCFGNEFENLIKIKEFKKGAFLIEVKNEPSSLEVLPYVSETLETNKEVFEKTNAALVINGGYYDPSNKKTVSDVVINQKIVACAKLNENLVFNKKLQDNMDKILNRSEFRILKTKSGEIFYDICEHNKKIQKNCTLLHSIQAGPMLLPQLRLEEEYFVHRNPKTQKINGQSASVLSKRPRTILALKENDPGLYIIIYSVESPTNLIKAAEELKSMGFQKVLNLDGGPSTSLNYKDYEIVSAFDENGRRLKSFLIVKPIKNLK